MRHPKSQDSPLMLPPFSCFSKCHTCGTQVGGHVLLCELGVPWAQHRPSAVTRPKIPPGVFLCHEQDQAVASWPPKLPRHCHIPGWSSEAGAAEFGGTEGKLLPWKAASLGSPSLWCGKAASPASLGSTGMLPVLSFSATPQGSASNGGDFDHRNSSFDLVPQCVASPSGFSFLRALFSPWDFTLFLQYLSTQELRVWMDFQNSSKISIEVIFPNPASLMFSERWEIWS